MNRQFFYKKLELDTILQQLSSYAILPLTKETSLQIEPTVDVIYLNQVLDEVDEALRIIIRMERAPIMMSSNYLMILEIVNKGGILTPLELYETVRLFTTIQANFRLLASLERDNISCFHYKNYLDQMVIIDNLNKVIKQSIDDTGEILDDASNNLKTIRSKLRTIDLKIKHKLQEIISKEQSKLSQSVVSIRNDRYVLPVKAEYKNSFKGAIHDISSSAQTFYIEPLAVMELTTQKVKLISDEKNEIERILRLLSQEVASNYGILKENFLVLVDIDLIFAKAMLAKFQNASRPLINNQHRLNLVNARHPLLKVAKVIPNNIRFGLNQEGIIITGPNTGGKTVLLKTVGLLSLMVKCGLLIPAEAKSEIMIYDQIYCDIGDDQSIENNLSTFSSHMTNIVGIIKLVTPNSLVLFDEIGAGTDPIEGSNLAIAILEYLLEKRISFITTTHYSELKAFAYRNNQVVNASMEFNQDTLSPTYKLILGRPGASNAFNIARRLGLDESIIKNAEDKTLTSDTEVRTLIKKLEHQSHMLEMEKIALEQTKDEYLSKDELLKNKLNMIEKTKIQIIKQAETDAKTIILKVKDEAKRILDEVTELKNREIKHHEIIAIKKELENLEEINVPKEKPSIIKRKPIVYDQVYLPHYEQYGVVQKILKSGDYIVSIGNINLKTKASEIEVVDKALKDTDALPLKGQTTKVITSSKLSLNLDLRGERYEDAKIRLIQYFDDAILTNVKQVTIIHGYGSGVLRELVQSYLKNHPQVASSRYGGAKEGGMGVTVVNFKE